MLQATLAGDTDTMSEIITYAHNTEVPNLSYNNETELSAVINLVYLAARDEYRVEREDKAGRGFESLTISLSSAPVGSSAFPDRSGL